MKRRIVILVLTILIVATLASAYMIFTKHLEQKMYNVRIGNVPAITYAPTYIAISLFMDDVNLNATYIAFSSGTKAREALITGDIDFASLSTVHVPLARLKDRPLKIIASLHNREIFSLMVRSDLKDTVKTIQDLRGLRIGFSSPGAGSWAFLVYVLKKSGLDPNADVEMVAVGDLPSMYMALKSGRVDAVMSWDPLTTQLMLSGEAYPLIDLYEYEHHLKIFGGKDVMSQVLVTTEDMIQKNPEIVKRVVEAHRMAIRFIKSESVERVAEVLKPYFEGMDVEVLKIVVERIKAAIPDDCSLSESAYYADIEPLVEVGVLEKLVSFEDAVDWSFAGRIP